MNKELITEVLKFPHKNGGSYYWEKECFYRPNWLIGTYIQASRILFHPKDNWVKIEYKLEGEWEKFFEGSIDNIEDFKTVLKLISYE